MASRNLSSRRRSYGRRVHELRERAHEDRRMSREELRPAGHHGAHVDHDGGGRDGGWHETRGAA